MTFSCTVHRDSVQIHNQTTPGSLAVGGLKPFTLYSAQIRACTQFGCTISPVASNMTLETGKCVLRISLSLSFCVCNEYTSPGPLAPFGLGSPALTVTGPTSIQVRWGEPYTTLVQQT